MLASWMSVASEGFFNVLASVEAILLDLSDLRRVNTDSAYCCRRRCSQEIGISVFVYTCFCLTDYCKRLRSIVSRKDLIQLEGRITKILGPGIMEVRCDDNILVRGRLSGRMKKYRIKVMIGDRVQVSVSPYDPTHGLITYRMK